MRPPLLLRRLRRRTHGASYTLGFVLIVPFYLLFLLAMFDAAFLLLVKVGTQYAAFAGARSAVAWWSAKPVEARGDRVEQAVWGAMAPFVGGAEWFLDGGGTTPPRAADQARQHAEVVRRAVAVTGRLAPNPDRPYTRATAPPPEDHLARRYLIAAVRTTTTVEVNDPDAGRSGPLPAQEALTRPQNHPHPELTVTATFRAPLYFPFASRFLDPDGSAPYEVPITSTATLPADGPLPKEWPRRAPRLNARNPVGIDYHSYPVKE